MKVNKIVINEKKNKCSPIYKNVLYYDFWHCMCIFRMIKKAPAGGNENVTYRCYAGKILYIENKVD